MKPNVEEYLQRADDELGEWKETLGRQYPKFLIRVLIARLLKAEDEIAFLRKCYASQVNQR